MIFSQDLSFFNPSRFDPPQNNSIGPKDISFQVTLTKSEKQGNISGKGMIRARKTDPKKGKSEMQYLNSISAEPPISIVHEEDRDETSDTRTVDKNTDSDKSEIPGAISAFPNPSEVANKSTEFITGRIDGN